MHTLFRSPPSDLRPGWRVAGFVAVAAVAAMASARVVHIQPVWIPRGLTRFAFTAAITWAFLRLEGRTLADVGLRLGGAWINGLGSGLAIGMGAQLAMALILWGAGVVQWTLTPGVGLLQIVGGFWLLFLGAVYEELLYRGYAFQRMTAAIGEQTALWITALAFAVMHWGSPGMTGATCLLGTLDITLASAAIGYAFLRTRSLGMPTGLHLGWNFAMTALLGFPVSGRSYGGLLTPAIGGRAWFTGGAFGPGASLPCLLVMGAVVVGFYRWRNEPVELPAPDPVSTSSF